MHLSVTSPALLCGLLLIACGGIQAAPADPPDAGGDGGPDAAGQTAPDYDRLFPADRVVDVDLAISDADWATLMAEPLEDVYVPADLTYDGISVPQIAIRLKGNSSRNSVAMMGSERFSFKLDLDEYVDDQRLLGVDKLNLNNGFKDPSFLREHLANQLYRGLGVPAPRTAFVRLTRNGQLFGLYLAVEQVEADFLRDRFADADGALYKPEMPEGDLTWRGDSIADYPSIEVKSDEATTDHTLLLAFLDALNHSSDAELEARLGAVLDVEGTLRYLAVTAALVNQDSYTGTAHNYYLYEDRSAGKLTVIAWDANEAFGNFSCGLPAQSLIDLPYDRPTCGDPARRPLVQRVLSVPAWKARYEELLAELLAGGFTTSAITGEVEALAALIRADVAADPSKFFTTTDFETNLTTDLVRPGPGGASQTTFGLTSFTSRRTSALDAQLP